MKWACGLHRAARTSSCSSASPLFSPPRFGSYRVRRPGTNGRRLFVRVAGCHSGRLRIAARNDAKRQPGLLKKAPQAKNAPVMRGAPGDDDPGPHAPTARAAPVERPEVGLTLGDEGTSPSGLVG